MHGMITYRWPGFMLEHNRDTGHTITRYPEFRWSGSDIVEDDAYHAARLGITPARHRLVHELLHHVVGFALGYAGSQVVRDDAHHVPQQQPQADDEEWKTTALTYHVYDRMCQSDAPGNYYIALHTLREGGADVDALRRYVRWLIDAADVAPAGTVISLT